MGVIIEDRIEVYVFNEEGLISENRLNPFIKELLQLLNKEFNNNKLMQIKKDSLGTCVEQELESCELNIRFYEKGYLIKIIGTRLKIIKTLLQFERLLDFSKKVYVSPSQRLVSDSRFLLKRKNNLYGVAFFLDSIFNNSFFLESLSSIE